MFAVDVRLSPLIPPCHLVCSRSFSLRGVRLAANLIVKMPFALGIILSLAVSFHRCSSRHPSRIRRLIITRTKSLLITQQGAGGLGGVTGIVEKAVPGLVRCGEFLIILRFESGEKNGRPTVFKDCGRGALVDAMRACYAATLTLAAKRGVLGSGVKMSVFGLRQRGQGNRA